MKTNRFNGFSIYELKCLREAFMTHVCELEWASMDTSQIWKFVDELDDERGSRFNAEQEDSAQEN